MNFNTQVLDFDVEVETGCIVSHLSNTIHREFHKLGGVVGVSGGIDSSVVLALSVHALGPERVTAVMMPDKDSAAETLHLSRLVAEHFGIQPILEEITPVLEGFGCYRRRDEAIQRVFPEYDAQAGYKAKITLPANLMNDDKLNFFSLTIVTPEGQEKTSRLPAREYAQIVAASNFKQRTRMSMLYYHAELRNYAVVGTANKNEHDQGFFVKYGDGGVDLQPLAHLYKTQVYMLARYLGVPEEIQQRPPTTDTYSAPCTQEEFFFRLPFETMDLIWYALEQGIPADEAAATMGLTEIQVQRVYADLNRKKRSTEYLRRTPVIFET